MRDDDGWDDNNDSTGKPPADRDSEREKRRRHFRKEKKLKSTSVRFGSDLVETLKREVERRETTISALVCKVMADYAADLEHPSDRDVM